MKKRKAMLLLMGCAVVSMLMLAASAACAGAEDLTQAVQIVLDQAGSTASDGSVIISGSVVTITKGGTYAVSGTLTEGQLRVETDSSDKVELVLSGVSISNSTDAALHVENAKRVTVRLQSGTENEMQSGQEVEITADTAADESASGGAVYARDDLTITGEGALTVRGYINNGIQTSNDLVIEGGVITVQAVNNGLKGKDSVTITGGEITLITGGDGIKSDSTDSEEDGTVTISGGSFVMTCGGDGVQAETMMTISGGTFAMTCGSGSAGVSHAAGGNMWGATGWDMEDEDEPSTKGLKSGGDMALSGGTFVIDSRDDAIHADGSIVITGGDYTLSTGDDAIHADASLTVEGGDIRILTSYEGLEANQILIAGGDISVTASDDGVNANGGDVMGMMGGGMGWKMGAWGGAPQNDSAFDAGSAQSGASDEMPNLCITGGSLVIYAEGDGLDSNGNILVEGGTVIVNGPEGSGNGSIDYGTESGGTCTITGGTVLALGAAGMAETFGSGSTQCSFLQMLSGSFSAGDEITIADSSGHALITYTAVKRGNCVVFSSPELIQGETYTVTAGSEQIAVTLTEIATGSTGGGFGRGGKGGRGI